MSSGRDVGDEDRRERWVRVDVVEGLRDGREDDDGDAAVVVAEIGADGGGVWTTGAEWGG